MFSRKKPISSLSTSQLELPIERPKERDRNHRLGGRSFYFFDFDDNVAYLSTPIIIFHRESGEEKEISSGQYAKFHRKIGQQGAYKEFEVRFDDQSGSFRHFRDQSQPLFERIIGKKLSFIEDIEEAIGRPDYLWKAPSWNCFYHATYNQRPISVITARGHRPQTIQRGIHRLVKHGHLPTTPNYLSIYPVSNPQTREELGDPQGDETVSQLKRKAIRQSVERAIEKYGYNAYHRFGMSDDDPKNIELITEEMKILKQRYPDMSFFVIQTYDDSFSKREVLANRTRSVITRSESQMDQLSLFSV